MKLNDLKIDAVKFEEGAWVENIPDMGELRLKVRGIGNADFRRLQAKLIEAEPRQFKIGGRIQPDRQDAITAECLINTVLIDWEGLTGEDGAALPYSKEQAQELLTKPEYRRFRDAVAWAASVVADEVAEETDVAGNSSKKRSAGS